MCAHTRRWLCGRSVIHTVHGSQALVLAGERREPETSGGGDGGGGGGGGGGSRYVMTAVCMGDRPASTAAAAAAAARDLFVWPCSVSILSVRRAACTLPAAPPHPLPPPPPPPAPLNPPSPESHHRPLTSPHSYCVKAASAPSLVFSRFMPLATND